MDNEVVIHVTVDEDVDRGFDRAKSKARGFNTDIVKDGAKAGIGLGKNIADGVGQSLTAAKAGSGQILAGIGVVAAPLIGATLAAAVIGVAGGAGIAGGMALAAKDPAVAKAATDLGDQVGDSLKASAKPFVPVMLESIGKVRKGFMQIRPDLDSIFANSSKLVSPLVDGAISAVKKITSGISDAVSNAGPVFESFGGLIDGIGGAVGDMFSTLGQDADAGASAIDDLTNATVNFISTVTGVIHGLAEIKGGLDDFDAKIDDVRHKLEDRTGWDITADGMSNAERKAKELADANSDKLKPSIDGVTESTEGETSALQGLAAELKAQTDPVFGLLKAQQDLKDAQDETADATKKHGRNSDEAKEALRKQALAALSLEGNIEKLGGTFDGRMSPALRRTLQAAGLTDRAINGLESQFNQARRAGDRFTKRYTATLGVQNYKSVMYQLNNVESSVRDIPRAVNVAIRITGDGNVSRQAANIRKNYAHGGVVGGAASGGLRNGETWVGEYGPELLELPPGTRVNSNADSMRKASQNREATGPLQVVLSFNGGDDVTRAVMKGIRAEVRDNGGNVQQSLGTTGV